jgi:hypothetical protein
MSGLSMKGFGKAAEEGSSILDLTSLESNPRYNPEGVEPEGVEPEGFEPEGLEPEGLEPEGLEPEGVEPENGEPEGVEPEGGTPEGVEPETGQEGNTQVTEVSEELIFQSLSEKLGRTITSYEDLTVAPAVELDPEVQAFNDWKQKTGRPLQDFLKFSQDFEKVGDLEIAREFLQLEYPSFNPDEIELELQNFSPNEEDLDSEAARRALELKKYATKGRKALEGLKVELGEPSIAGLTPEIKKQLDYAKQVQSQIESNQGQQKDYSEGITKAALTTEGMKLNLSDELSVDFKITEKDKKSIPQLIDEMPHWRTADGKWNHQAVVQDAIKIRHFDAMVKLAYEQGLSSGKEDLLKKAKNSTLGNPQGNGNQPQGSKKPVIEGLDKMLGGQKLTMKFGRKQ